MEDADLKYPKMSFSTKILFLCRSYFEMRNDSLFIILLLLYFTSCGSKKFSSEEINAQNAIFEYESGAITRGDTSKKQIAVVFTGDEYADGAIHIQKVLSRHKIPASFFFTGNFYKNPHFQKIIESLVKNGYYLGAHSDEHLLYCDWNKRDSLLVSQEEFGEDLKANYSKMSRFGINKEDALFFLPPYEWYNDTIAEWTKKEGLQLINFTHGTLSHADYTSPEDPNYRSNESIYKSIMNFEAETKNGLNGFILLMHIGVSPKRTEKFYYKLNDLIIELKERGYKFKRIDALLKN